MTRHKKGFVTRGDVIMHLSVGGFNRRKAAASAGVSESTFRRWMRGHRVNAPRSDTKLNPVIASQIRDQISLGQSRSSVAAQAGVHPHTVDRVLHGDTWRKA